MNFVKQKYSMRGLWSLFLMCAFPLHLWALIMIFRDLSWVAARTNAWDAVGLASYGMVFAFVETVIIFAVVALLGLFTPKLWNYDKRIGFLSLLVLITSIWAMLGQLFFIWNLSLPDVFAQFLRSSSHPFRFLYGGVLAVVIPTVLLPVYFFVKSKKIVLMIQELVERFSVVAMFYLVFDLLGFIIVVFRNIA
jgi:hypothetical protein